MSSGQDATRRWEVPVLVGQDLHVESLVIYAVGVSVRGHIGGVPFVIPPQSDDLLCESVRQAREVVEQDGPS